MHRHVIDLRDTAPARPDPAVAEVLTSTADALSQIRFAADLIGAEGAPAANGRLAATISTVAGDMAARLRAFAAGGAVLALALVAVVALPGGGRAEAAEAPQPDPAATVYPAPADVPVYPVALSSATVRVAFPMVLPAPVSGSMGLHCGRVFGPTGHGVGVVGSGCGRTPFVTIVASFRAVDLGYGRTEVWLHDDATGTEAPAVVDARRPSKFGAGYFEDRGRGDLYALIPVTMYSPALGRWVPQVQSPVQIQELTRRGWRVRATLVTNPPGVAAGIVHLGGGRHVIRAVRPAGVTVWGTTGRTRVVTVTTEPLDID